MNLLDELKVYFPKYEVVLPVSKLKVLFTPFKVKDAKNLSIILQENNKKLALIALYEIIKNNTDNINIDELCIADAEFLFLHIRSKSVDEHISIIFEKNKYELNISEIVCINSLNKKIISINNNISIELESPIFSDLLKLNSFETNDFYKVCIKKIIVQKEIYDFNKFVPDEIKEIINNLPISVLKEFDNFLSNQPRLTATIKLLDGSEKEVNGLLDFFIFR
tara:strand:+ start:286 stop:951 length:666 start_codon:yes stop_codon:yes gene_type:complete